MPRFSAPRPAGSLLVNPVILADGRKARRNRTTVLAEALHEGEAEAIRDKLVEGALAGDRVLLKFCASLLFAKPGPRSVELDLAPGQENDPLAVLAAATRAMADGEIAPSEAVAIARVVNATARLLLDRAEARLAETQHEENTEPADERDAETPAAAPVSRLYPAAPETVRRLPVFRLYPRRSRRAMLHGTASIGALEIGCGRQLAEAPDPTPSGHELDARKILVPDAALRAAAA